MASVVLECKVCAEAYDSKDRRPLSLECGHTFCQSCLRHMGSHNRNICPTCRNPTTKSINQLPVIFDLIPTEENSTTRCNGASAADKCKDHGCVLEHFCAECGEMVCRKCIKSSHFAHTVEFIDDILNMDPDSAAFTKELENKIERNIYYLTRSMSLPVQISKAIDELPGSKKDLDEWINNLCSQKELAKQLLETWNDARLKSSGEKFDLFKKLCCQWKGVVLASHPVKELSSFTKKLEELNKYVALLEELVRKYGDASEEKESLHIEKLFPNNEGWRVYSEDDLQGSMSSTRAGNTPSFLFVVSPPTAPIRKLPEVLKLFGFSFADNCMSVKPLDTFWAPSTISDAGLLLPFIEEFGRKVRVFYGSPREAVTLCRVNPGLSFFGVRLTSMNDVNLCSTVPKTPRCVSCINSLPAEAGERMLQLGWEPKDWHFPDAQPRSVQRIISLMAPAKVGVFDHACDLSIFLPRCSLTENDFSVMLKKYSKHDVNIYCEHVSFSSSIRANLGLMAQENNYRITLKWTIPLDWV